MKGLISWLFIFLYGVALLKPIEPLIEYYANQDFFANVLCINKDKPELACNGQCILMQKLQKASNDPISQSPSAPTGKIDLKEYPIGFISFLNAPASTNGVDNSLFNSNYTDRWPSDIILDIFHPPS